MSLLQQSVASRGRIDHLDGIRGLAILLVLLYHAYARWPGIVPYGNTYAGIDLFEFGWLGVNLFFLVSGFVILMTLENCRGTGDFLYRRWIRLFPAMLFATLLIYGTAPFFPERPGGQPTLASVLPGLTFIDIKWYQLAFGWPEKPLEGAFWSLYVEFKFYVVAGVVYFWRGRNALLWTLLLAHAVSALCTVAEALYPGAATRAAVRGCTALGINHFGWFAAGALFYLFHKSREPRWFLAALAVAVSCTPVLRKLSPEPVLPAILVILLFAGALTLPALQSLLRQRLLLLLGFASYPLYLIHENLLVVATVKLALAWPACPPWLLPVLPAALIIATGWWIARHVEPRLRDRLRRAWPGPARA